MRPILVLVLACAASPVLLTDASAQNGGDWGTIKGRIIWDGKLPDLPEIVLPNTPAGMECLKAGKGKPPPNLTWVINPENKGIKNTFVWLAAADKKPLPIKPELKPIKIKQVEVDQPVCHFIPQSIAVREGQILLVKNSAPFSHNFKWSGNPENSSGNVILISGATHPIKDLKADYMPFAVECNLHPWMKGWIRVFDHPYYAVTDENGAFEFKDAPAGNWRLMVWHGSSGWKGGTKGRTGDPVTVEAGKTRDLGAIASYP